MDWRSRSARAGSRPRAYRRRGRARRWAIAPRAMRPPPRRSTAAAIPTARRRCRSSLPEPFEQRRHVHLVGLVVAGEYVHHDVDADAEGELALARLAGHERQQRLAVAADGPGAGEVVGRNEDRRHAVTSASGPAFLSGFGCGQRLDPQRAVGETAGEVAQEIE